MSSPPLPDRITPMTPQAFDSLGGGSLICVVLMAILYGMSTLQTYLYYLNFEDDRALLKLTVFLVWILGTTHTALTTYSQYISIILSYGDPLLAIGGNWSVYTGVGIGILLCWIVQTFFAKTIYNLTRGRTRVLLTGFLALLIVTEIGFGTLATAKLIQLWDFVKLPEAKYIAIIPLLISRIMADATTAVSLCLLLRNRRTPFKRSLKLINTLVIYAINRFILTSACAFLITIALLVTGPDSIWPIEIEFVLVGLYVNSFMATLNARLRLRGVDMDVETSLPTVSSLKIAPCCSSNETGATARLDLSSVVMDSGSYDDMGLDREGVQRTKVSKVEVTKTDL